MLAHINILANLILNSHFSDSRCLLTFAESFDYNGSLPLVNLAAVSPNYDLIFHYFGCQGILIASPDPIAIFVDFEREIRLRMERFNRRKFLIIPTEFDRNFTSNFFQLKQLDFVADLLVIEAAPSAAYYALKTHQFVGTKTHRPILLDKWYPNNASFLHNGDLYPDKISDQKGRPLRMACFNYKPYNVIGRRVGEHYGSELSTAVQFGLKLNMSPMPVVNENDYWGDIFPNWTGNGLLGNIVSDRADVGFGSLCTWAITYHYLDLSKPVVRTGITALVPAPQLLAGWLTPLYSYSPILWAYVSLTFSATILFLALVLFCYNRSATMQSAYKTHKSGSFFKFLGIAMLIVAKPIILQSITKREVPLQAVGKFLMIFTEMLGLCLTSTYSSGLATVMTIPKFDAAIDTDEQLAGSDINWGATQDAWITSIQSVEYPVYVRIVGKFQSIPEEELRMHSKSGHYGFAIERLPNHDFAIGSYIQEDVINDYHVMGEDVYWDQTLTYLRKNSVLLPQLDAFILRITQAGLIYKWQRTAVQLFMDAKVQAAVRNYGNRRKEHPVGKLKWSHVQGAFAVLLLGYAFSLVIFGAEMAINANWCP